MDTVIPARDARCVDGRIFSSKNPHGQHPIRGATMIVASAFAVGLVVPTAIWFIRLVSLYGFDGTMRIIWEGSPYQPRVRERMEELDEVQDEVDDLDQSILTSLERRFQTMLRSEESRALNPVSSTASHDVLIRQEKESDLRVELAGLSDELDKLAARVDAVASGTDLDVKVRKKAISSNIVEIMGRTDRLLEMHMSYFEASNPSPSGLVFI
jgi:hypothetical protein